MRTMTKIQTGHSISHATRYHGGFLAIADTTKVPQDPGTVNNAANITTNDEGQNVSALNLSSA